MFYAGSDYDVNDFLNSLCSAFLYFRQVVTPRTSVTCICCDEADSKLLSRCLKCEGFLCEKGMETHKTMKFLRNHQLVSFKDFQSGKVNLNSVLKAYSQISNRGRSQKFQNLNFLHLFITLPLKTHFPKGIEQKSFQGEIRAIFP